MKPTIIIDGAEFSDLPGFFHHFQKQALDFGQWGNNLDAFNDVLRGGFGTPTGGFVLLWKNHRISRLRLGHQETERFLRASLSTCHSSNVHRIHREIGRAQAQEGPTVFVWLVEIIRDHGPGGIEEADGVELALD